MLREFIAFEIRHHLRQPVFALAAATFFLMGLGLISSEVGVLFSHAPSIVHRNAPIVIVRAMPFLSLLGLFVITAFVASSTLRDFESGTHPLFFSKPLRKIPYLAGRFIGSMVVSVLVLVAALLGLLAGNFAPWQDPDRLGPFTLAPYVSGLLFVVVPDLLIMGAVFFAVAIWSRRLLATYLCVIVFLGLQDLMEAMARDFESRFLGSLLEPSGVTALEVASRYWTVSELNTRMPDLAGALLGNRLLWLGIGLAAFLVGVARFRFTDPCRTPRKLLPPTLPAEVERTVPSAAQAAPIALPRPEQRFSRLTAWRQFLRQTRLETVGVTKSAPFIVLLAFGVMLVVSFTFFIGSYRGTPVYPLTASMLQAIQAAGQLVLMIIVVFYGGEIVFRERAIRIAEVCDALPVPGWVLLASKTLALLLVVGAFTLAGMLATVAVQLSRGFLRLEPALYAKGLAITALTFLPLVVLSVFVQVAANQKFVGYLLMIVFLVFRFASGRLGFEHNLYRYGGRPPIRYSDMNGFGHDAVPFLWFNAYWAFAAVILLALSFLLWVRGTDTSIRSRLAAARKRWSRPLQAAVIVAAAGFIAAGAFIYVNTNVRNEYMPRARRIDRLADYEKKYRPYADAPLPRITDVYAEVDIYPMERRVAIRGRYRLENRGDGPIQTLPVTISPRFVEGVLPVHGGVSLTAVDLPPHKVRVADRALGFYAYDLAEPLAPGGAIDFGFTVSVDHGAFLNEEQNDLVVANGTFFTNRNFFPFLGYARPNQLIDPIQRRRRGLPPPERMASLDDLPARGRNYLEADWIRYEAVVSTSDDQIAITQGHLEREWREGGRRYFHYRAEAPIINLLAFTSGRYAVARDRWGDVGIEVCYHPGHAFNIDRFIRATKISLDYFAASFGPYPHRDLRIIEIPNYHGQMAAALASTIPFSESWGFTAQIGAGDIDHVTFVTAHEIAHQWWNHQVIPADVQGATMVSEALAEYSALMVMEKEQGPEMVRHFLKYDLDRYLEGRGKESVQEMPLLLVENQMYIHYAKGSLAMYALRDAVGEEALNGALRRFLAATAFQGPPYTTSRDLLARLREIVPPEKEGLIGDLLETITLFDNRVAEATSSKQADGTYLVEIRARSRKLRADGLGEEHEVPLDDWIDIGVFGEEEKQEEGGRRREKPLLIEKRRVTGGETVFKVSVGERPVRAGIDPYNKLIDRDSGDNLRRVIELGPAAD